LVVGCAAGAETDPVGSSPAELLEAGAPVAVEQTAVDQAAISMEATPPASAPPKIDPPVPMPGCELGTPVRVPLTADMLGVKRLSRVDSLSIARAAGKSLIVFRADGDSGCDHDGCYTSTAYALEVALGAAPKELPSSGTGISPGVDVFALVMGGEVTAVTQGHRGAAAMAGEHDRLFVMTGGARTLDVRGANGGAFVGAATDSGALVVIAGWEPTRPGPASGSVRAMTLRGGAKKAPSEVLAWGMSDERYEEPTLSIDGEKAAAAFVFHREAGRRCDETNGCFDHTATTRLEAAWLDASSAAVVGKRTVVATGAVSGPAVLVRGAELGLIWSEAGALRLSKWKAGEAAPTAEKLDVAGSEPSVAKAPQWQVAVAFVHDGSVELGFGGDLGAAAAAATSAGSGKVRSPHLALDEGGRGHLVWLEAAARGHDIVHRSVSCR